MFWVHALSTSSIWGFGGREGAEGLQQLLLPGCNLGIMETLTHGLSPGTASPVTNVPAELCQARQNGFVCILSGDLFLGIKYGTCK